MSESLIENIDVKHVKKEDSTDSYIVFEMLFRFIPIDQVEEEMGVRQAFRSNGLHIQSGDADADVDAMTNHLVEIRAVGDDDTLFNLFNFGEALVDSPAVWGIIKDLQEIKENPEVDRGMFYTQRHMYSCIKALDQFWH